MRVCVMCGGGQQLTAGQNQHHNLAGQLHQRARFARRRLRLVLLQQLVNRLAEALLSQQKLDIVYKNKS